MALDIHLSPRGAHLLTALLAILLLIAFLLHVQLALGGFVWAYPLAAIPLGYVILMLLPLSGRGARLLPFFKLFVPWIDLVEQERRRIAENGRLVQQIEETLDFYRLGALEQVFRGSLVEEIYGTAPHRIMCKRIVPHLKKSGSGRPNRRQSRHLTVEVLELLHQERQGGEVASRLWERKKRGLKDDLVPILIESDRLPSKMIAFPYAENDYVARLLLSLPSFKLDALRSQLKSVDQMWSDSQRLLGFLEDHKLGSTVLASASEWFAFVEGQLGFPIAGVDKETHKILLSLADDAIASLFPNLAESLRDAYSLIAAAVFICEELTPARPDLRELACLRVADNERAIPIIMALLEFREQLEVDYRVAGETFVSMKFLFQNWEGKIGQISARLGHGYKIEKQCLRQALIHGTWNDRLPMLIRRGLEAVENSNREVLEAVRKLQEKTNSYDSAKRVFRQLKLQTIERYLEARNINAYLMTFEGTRGRIAQLIECLASREKLRELGIDPDANGEPKYVFKPYTAHTRIGVVPRGWSFERFHETFQDDFSKIVANREDLFPATPRPYRLENMELTLQRFGLQDHYAFVSKYRSERAIEHIKELFAEILTAEEQVALLSYEHAEATPILNALIEGSITELAGELFQIDQVFDPQQKARLADQKRVLDRDDDELKRALFAFLGRSSAQEMGRSLKIIRDRRLKEAEAFFSSTLASRYPGLFTEERAQLICRSYFHGLRVIAETAGW